MVLYLLANEFKMKRHWTISRMIITFLLLPLLILDVRVKGLSTIASEEYRGKDLEQSSGCYFSAKYQGEYAMQVISGNKIQPEKRDPVVPYVTLNITFNSIPAWGLCHRRVGDKVLLRDTQGGFSECIRCFQLVRRARNILEVFSQELNRCYTSETAALASCSQLRRSAILYRTLDVDKQPTRNEYCPIAGKYRFKYVVNYEHGTFEHNGPEAKDECAAFSSEVDNCPNGSLLQMRFHKCTFEDHDISFKCLGSWAASGGTNEVGGSTSSDTPRYVALVDSRGESNFHGPAKWRRPLYRCGLYHVDSKTGKTYLSLSSDSSCSLNLHNSTSGYESFVLTKTTTQKKMPSYVINNLATFPHWAQGEWEETLIVNGTMTFNDLNGYRGFTFVTVDSNDELGRYIVFSRDQCEQEAYICMIMKQRSENVLEFITIGSDSSPVYRSYLCNDTSILENDPVWWTLARLERSIESPCPITGQYIGEISDMPGMCAELSSNCFTREIMYFKVYDCQSRELYEERTYFCLGQWEEQGLTYTYTLRNDTGTHECFVGMIVSDDEIYIKEAGDYCLRTIDPKTEGMRLYKNGQCYSNSSSPAPTIPPKTTTTTTTSRPSTILVSTTVNTTSVANVTTIPRFTRIPPRAPTKVKTPTTIKSSSDSICENTFLVLGLLFVCMTQFRLH